MSCAGEDNLAYYSLADLKAKTDYTVESPLSAHEFILNICQSVRSELWSVRHVPDDRVAAFYRGAHGDFAMGTVNTTFDVVDSNPVLHLTDGSPCPNAGDTKMLANTAIRFICEPTMFGAGKPQLIAQFPSDDDHACSFYFEWKTRYACPSARKPAGWLNLILVFASILFIAILVYVVGITLYNRFFLGLRGLDQFPSIPWLSPMRFFNYVYDKITGRGDGFVGGPRLFDPSSSNGNANGNGFRRGWGFGSSNNGSKWRWGNWGSNANSRRNGYGLVPEEEEGILDNGRRSSFDDEEDATPTAVGVNGFDNEWAGVRSNSGRGQIDGAGVIRL